MVNEKPLEVVASGQAAELSRDVLEAHHEALVFCLDQVGAPISFSESDRQQINHLMVEAFSGLPGEAQIALSNAGSTWTQYFNAWSNLSLEKNKEFAFNVLRFAYGKHAAAGALGFQYQNSGSESTGAYIATEPSFSEDYWKSYGGGIPQGDGTMSLKLSMVSLTAMTILMNKVRQ